MEKLEYRTAKFQNKILLERRRWLWTLCGVNQESVTENKGIQSANQKRVDCVQKAIPRVLNYIAWKSLRWWQSCWESSWCCAKNKRLFWWRCFPGDARWKYSQILNSAPATESKRQTPVALEDRIRPLEATTQTKSWRYVVPRLGEAIHFWQCQRVSRKAFLGFQWLARADF